MSKKLILLVLAIVSSALVFGCNSTSATDDVFTFSEYFERENIPIVKEVLGSAEQCNAFISTLGDDSFFVMENATCIKLENGKIGVAYSSSINQPLNYEEGASLFAPPLVPGG